MFLHINQDNTFQEKLYMLDKYYPFQGQPSDSLYFPKIRITI